MEGVDCWRAGGDGVFCVIVPVTAMRPPVGCETGGGCGWSGPGGSYFCFWKAFLQACGPPTIGRVIWVASRSIVSSVPGSGRRV